MAESIHSLSTCKIPISALTQYYRRNLEVEPPPGRHRSSAIERRHDVRLTVGDMLRESVVTVAEFAAHVAYLEPVTGTGLLVMPRPDADVVVPPDSGWVVSRGVDGRVVGLSLHAADRAHALEQLDLDGWRLLDHEQGLTDAAGWTADGRLAVCLSAARRSERQLVLADFQYAITALHIAADLRHDW
ncbi:hypothetical protein GCM10009789_36980 [Kribbella sancticallisti]|uniref:Uncharacterized protein n=1 Tax=Kribbella sancticallisti TaxID=460087 RepID=A0ABN2DNX0_9ACTN